MIKTISIFANKIDFFLTIKGFFQIQKKKLARDVKAELPWTECYCE